MNTATTLGSFRLPPSRRAAKSKLSELAEKADAGQEVIITWRGRPVVELLRGKQQNEEVGPECPALINEIRTFSRACKFGRNNLRKLVATSRI